MTVTFVPPRTLIRGVVPSTIVSTGVSHPGSHDETEDDLEDDVEMGEIDDHGGGGSLPTKKLVVPGQLVTDDPQFMRLHPPFWLRRNTDVQRPWDIYR